MRTAVQLLVWTFIVVGGWVLLLHFLEWLRDEWRNR